MQRRVLFFHLTFTLAFIACADVRLPSEMQTDFTDANQNRGQASFVPGASVANYGPEIPLAYYELSLVFSKRTAGFTPPVQARAYAYMGLALYEAVVRGMPNHQSIAGQLHGIGALPSQEGTPYHWPLAASAALAEAMRGLWGGTTNRAAENTADINGLEAAIAAQQANVPAGIAKLSIAFGRDIGAAIFATSMNDGGHEGYKTNFPAYDPPQGSGLWVPTAAGQLALQPYWGTAVQTFALTSGAQCDPGGPPAYSLDPTSEFYGEAQTVYQAVNNLTPGQLTIAQFWADGPGTISGPGHSLAITNQILIQEAANLEVAAETYARVGLSVADAVTAVWWAKYQYNVLRPVTYIKAVFDAAWAPVLPTPPFPEYISAHSSQSAAAATALEYVFGENVPFVDHAHDADGFAPRAFTRIYAAAEEAGISRIYAGIHFPSGNLDGQTQGRCVAARVNDLDWRND